MKLKTLFCFFLVSFGFFQKVSCQINFKNEIISTLKDHIIEEADWAMKQEPITITANTSPRSAGTVHDFYSEGDYWWPDSTNVNGPYIQRDGMTNPDNFTAHRLSMIRFSKIIGALASAYCVSNDDKYVKHALIHLKAWFLNSETRMNPHLLFAQAIKGRVTGRGVGIIDTIQLMEVAQGILVMKNSNAFENQISEGIKKWFSSYLNWLTSHQYGKDEMNAENNHGTCWVMQVACFARLTENNQLISFCRDRYKNILLPLQMERDGSFPLELKRTKPYGYSIFNLDAMTMICHILLDEKNNLWNYETENKKSVRKGIEFLYPFLNDKSKWPFQKDVMYWQNWPVAQPSLIFGALAYKEEKWLDLWKKLDHDPIESEVVRNLPIRHPLIWIK
jgi:Alginate lyase